MELNSVYLSNSFSRVLNGVSRQYDKDTRILWIVGLRELFIVSLWVTPGFVIPLY